MQARVSPHTIPVASGTQKTAAISQATLDRNNTILCRVPDSLAAESQEKQREIYWKEKGRQAGWYKE